MMYEDQIRLTVPRLGNQLSYCHICAAAPVAVPALALAMASSPVLYISMCVQPEQFNEHGMIMLS